MNRQPDRQMTRWIDRRMDRQTKTDRWTGRQIGNLSDRHRHTAEDILTDREGRWKDRQTDRQIGWTDKQMDVVKEGHRDVQTQTDRQTMLKYIQIDRQTDTYISLGALGSIVVCQTRSC